MHNLYPLIAASVFLYAAATSQSINAQEQSSPRNDPTQHLSKNNCFMRLLDNDKVIVTAAFHSGAEGFADLEKLIDRRPWGEALSSLQREEIKKLRNQASPFLVVTLSKKQALVLEDHRDLIKWILVQSTTKPCS